ATNPSRHAHLPQLENPPRKRRWEQFAPAQSGAGVAYEASAPSKWRAQPTKPRVFPVDINLVCLLTPIPSGRPDPSTFAVFPANILRLGPRRSRTVRLPMIEKRLGKPRGSPAAGKRSHRRIGRPY